MFFSIFFLLLIKIIFLSRLKLNKLFTRDASYNIVVENDEIILNKEYTTCINPPIFPKISTNLVYVLF